MLLVPPAGCAGSGAVAEPCEKKQKLSGEAKAQELFGGDNLADLDQ